MLRLQVREREGVELEELALFFGEGGGQRAGAVACPKSLPEVPHARCFGVPLSVLPDLPNGGYRLRSGEGR